MEEDYGLPKTELTDFYGNVEEILENFDWLKVHKTMVALDWHWIETDGVPGVYQMIQQAKRQLRNAAGLAEGDFSSSGGFVAYNLGDGQLRLTFEVTSWESLGVL